MCWIQRRDRGLGVQGGLEVTEVQGPARIHLRIIGLTRWSACSLAEAWLQRELESGPRRTCRHVAPLVSGISVRGRIF